MAFLHKFLQWEPEDPPPPCEDYDPYRLARKPLPAELLDYAEHDIGRMLDDRIPRLRQYVITHKRPAR